MKCTVKHQGKFIEVEKVTFDEVAVKYLRLYRNSTHETPEEIGKRLGYYDVLMALRRVRQLDTVKDKRRMVNWFVKDWSVKASFESGYPEIDARNRVVFESVAELKQIKLFEE